MKKSRNLPQAKGKPSRPPLIGNPKPFNSKPDSVKMMAKFQDAFYSRQVENMQVHPKSKRTPKKQILMSPCTAKFALALSDPFSAPVRGVCIPHGTTDTQKVHAFARFDVVTTAFPTYIMLNPSLGNDCCSFYYTSTGTAADNGASPLSAASTLRAGWVRGNHNGPYSTAQLFAGSVQGRIVCSAVRIQYTGALTSESGLFYCYHDPEHSSVSGMTIADLGSVATSEIGAVSRIPCSLVTFPVDETEFLMSNMAGVGPQTTVITHPYSLGGNSFNTAFNNGTGFSDTIATTTVGRSVGLIGISGIPAGVTIHVEYITHMEYTGLIPGPAATPVSSDTEGTNKVIKAALQIPIMRQDDPVRNKDMWSYMYAGLQEVWHEAKPIVVPSIATALAALLV